jgi:hypothetical protein
MRIALTAVDMHSPSGALPLRVQHAVLEINEKGEWRVLLGGLKVDTLTLLQDLFASGEVARISLTTDEGDGATGMVRVARLSVGNASGAVLQGASPLS